MSFKGFLLQADLDAQYTLLCHQAFAAPYMYTALRMIIHFDTCIIVASHHSDHVAGDGSTQLRGCSDSSSRADCRQRHHEHQGSPHPRGSSRQDCASPSGAPLDAPGQFPV